MISNNIQFDISGLTNLKKECPNNPIISYLNINSLRNKIDQLRDICQKAPLDILCIDETKIDSSFPDSQFYIEGYQFPPFRKDRNKQDGGKIVSIKKGIIAKRIINLEGNFEGNCGELICLDLTISKKTWCILFVYRPPQNNNKSSFFNEISIYCFKSNYKQI